jgi:hypothetical protein
MLMYDALPLIFSVLLKIDKEKYKRDGPDASYTMSIVPLGSLYSKSIIP